MYIGANKRIAVVLAAVFFTVASVNLRCDAGKRPFTLADDIGLVLFGDPYTAAVEALTFSPDSRYFVVVTERGLLGLNRPESTLRIFRTENVRQFLLRPNTSRAPQPIWTISRSTYRNGPIITNVRWLADGTGIAFLAKSLAGNNQLFLADLKRKTIHALTEADHDVQAFDIGDRDHFAYSVRTSTREKDPMYNHPTSYVGTGRPFLSLVLPEFFSKTYDHGELWAVVDGRRFRIKDKSSGEPISLYSQGQKTLALSPDGRAMVAALPVDVVPPEWESQYPPAGVSSAARIRAGRQDRQATIGYLYVSEYVLIDLTSGDVKPLIRAPLGTSAGWWGAVRPEWSSDGRSIVLPDTFIGPNAEGYRDLRRPCVTVIELINGKITCLEPWKGQTANGGYEDGAHYIDHVEYVPGSSTKVTVSYESFVDGSKGSTTYERGTNGSWAAESTAEAPSEGEPVRISISIKQSINDPPVLVTSDLTTRTSRVIWDPNPQLKDIDLGEASVYRWKDRNGRDWLGTLFKPPDYTPGMRYPLVIQTHGLFGDQFLPSGTFPTAFAARELAASGIMVLQVVDCQYTHTPAEASCNVAGYESAVEQLALKGLVDAHRVGLIGFSRTCYYVMEALTTSAIHFEAASITDGVNEGYLQYILNVDSLNNGLAHESDAIIGSPPFGEGLQRWLSRSPEFKMEKVTAPLQVVALGPLSLPSMWEPYAALRYLNKPVDLIVLPRGTHVLTNPADRIASQTGTVHWFRFWLQDYEDPDPAKADQYKRWRELRKLQEENDKKAAEEKSIPIPQGVH